MRGLRVQDWQVWAFRVSDRVSGLGSMCRISRSGLGLMSSDREFGVCVKGRLSNFPLHVELHCLSALHFPGSRPCMVTCIPWSTRAKPKISLLHCIPSPKA